MKKFIRILLISVGIIIFAVFAAPLFMGVLNSGNGFGMLTALICLGYGVFFDKVNGCVKKIWKKPLGKLLLILLLLIVTAIKTFFVAVTAEMVMAADNPPQKETTVVVLGCRVMPDGPGIMLEERLCAAKKFLQENPSVKCVLSGGKGDNEPISEAECMKSWLMENGIDEDRLYIENKSSSTRENLEFSMKVMEENRLISDITIVTNEFHHYRANKVAEELGLNYYNVSAGTYPVLLPAYYVRELLGAFYDLVLGY